jgi:hypothetical protein
MIVWEIRDDKGLLITREFSERNAILTKMRRENRGAGVLHLSKVFQAEDRDIDPTKKWHNQKLEDESK